MGGLQYLNNNIIGQSTATIYLSRAMAVMVHADTVMLAPWAAGTVLHMISPHVQRRDMSAHSVKGMHTTHMMMSANARLTMYRFRGDGPWLGTFFLPHCRNTTKHTSPLDTRPTTKNMPYVITMATSMYSTSTLSTICLSSNITFNARLTVKLNGPPPPPSKVPFGPYRPDHPWSSPPSPSSPPPPLPPFTDDSISVVTMVMNQSWLWSLGGLNITVPAGESPLPRASRYRVRRPFDFNFRSFLSGFSCILPFVWNSRRCHVSARELS